MDQESFKHEVWSAGFAHAITEGGLADDEILAIIKKNQDLSLAYNQGLQAGRDAKPIFSPDLNRKTTIGEAARITILGIPDS